MATPLAFFPAFFDRWRRREEDDEEEEEERNTVTHSGNYSIFKKIKVLHFLFDFLQETLAS